MKLFTRKIYRKFPELDAFSDEQCEKLVEVADRGVDRTIERFFLPVAVGLFGLALVLLIANPLDANKGGLVVLPTDLWQWTGLVLCLLLLTLILAAVNVAINTSTLRQRIRFILHTRGSCKSCEYSLVGVRVDAFRRVICPECGMISVVDGSVGKLARDGDRCLVSDPHGSASPAALTTVPNQKPTRHPPANDPGV